MNELLRNYVAVQCIVHAALGVVYLIEWLFRGK